MSPAGQPCIFADLPTFINFHKDRQADAYNISPKSDSSYIWLSLGVEVGFKSATKATVRLTGVASTSEASKMTQWAVTRL